MEHWSIERCLAFGELLTSAQPEWTGFTKRGPMGGTAPICPFCRKHLQYGGVKDHIKAKHPELYQEWIDLGQPPYWRYDLEGNFR